MKAALAALCLLLAATGRSVRQYAAGRLGDALAEGGEPPRVPGRARMTGCEE